jgi:hypothetical protein
MWKNYKWDFIYQFTIAKWCCLLFASPPYKCNINFKINDSQNRFLYSCEINILFRVLDSHFRHTYFCVKSNRKIELDQHRRVFLMKCQKFFKWKIAIFHCLRRDFDSSSSSYSLCNITNVTKCIILLINRHFKTTPFSACFFAVSHLLWLKYKQTWSIATH